MTIAQTEDQVIDWFLDKIENKREAHMKVEDQVTDEPIKYDLGPVEERQKSMYEIRLDLANEIRKLADKIEQSSFLEFGDCRTTEEGTRFCMEILGDHITVSWMESDFRRFEEKELDYMDIAVRGDHSCGLLVYPPLPKDKP